MKRKNRSDTPNDGSQLISRRSVLQLASAAALSLGFPTIVRAKLTLKVTYYDDFAPYSFTKPDGSATGIYVDFLNEMLGKRAGIALTHQAMPWARAQQEVKDSNADAFCTSPTEERLKYTTVSKEGLLQQNRMVVYAKNNPKADQIRKITKEEDLKQFSIGTYYGDAKINTLFKGMNVDLSPDNKQAFQKLATGRIDIAVNDGAIWKYIARSLDIRDKLDAVLLSNAPATFLFVRKSHPNGAEILDIFDKAVVTAKKDGTLDRIISSYTGDKK